jgi:hypothetical protein
MVRLIDKNDRRARQSAFALRMGSVPYFEHNGKCTPSLMGGNTVHVTPGVNAEA